MIQMSIVDLIDSLRDTIAGSVKEMRLQTNVPGKEPKAPQVITGFLPNKKPRESQETPDFPFVIVRYLSDEDSGTGARANVKILVGTYSEDEQSGWRDTLRVMARIKQDLKRQGVVGKAFRLELPVKMEMPEEQPVPEWFGMISCTFTVPQVREEGGYQHLL